MPYDKRLDTTSTAALIEGIRDVRDAVAENLEHDPVFRRAYDACTAMMEASESYMQAMADLDEWYYRNGYTDLVQ